jgi:multicomponent Na+:H+ antiporter subunit G
MNVGNVIGQILIGLGAVLFASATIGLWRLPDVYNRTNSVAKGGTLGMLLVVAGAVVMIPSPTTIVTGCLAIAAQLFTSPISAYAVGRAAYRSGVPLAPSTHRDELARYREQLKQQPELPPH